MRRAESTSVLVNFQKAKDEIGVPYVSIERSYSKDSPPPKEISASRILYVDETFSESLRIAFERLESAERWFDETELGRLQAVSGAGGAGDRLV